MWRHNKKPSYDGGVVPHHVSDGQLTAVTHQAPHVKRLHSSGKQDGKTQPQPFTYRNIKYGSHMFT